MIKFRRQLISLGSVAFICLLCFGVVSMKTPAENARVSNLSAPDSSLFLPIGGNTWKSENNNGGGKVTNEGIVNWTEAKAVYITYFRTKHAGNLKLWVRAKDIQGTNRLRVTIGKRSTEIRMDESGPAEVFAGTWTLNDTGYIAITLTGISKTATSFPTVDSYKISGSIVDAGITYVKDNEGNFYYWGRRGPSVHLGYLMPDTIKAAWFYNEITVPKGEDIIGSYYMANGFGEGYFGIQVNSEKERRILFSVWSPYHTDNPNDIPADQKIQLLKKGATVHTGEFGNEGSGGQSYLRYNWVTGNTYKFLLHGQPDGSDHTTYTAYFFAPELNEWMLIASFRRPKLSTYLKRFHSFLENFSPEQGKYERHVLFNNQWVRTNEGKWIELNKARFTGDNTAVKGYRMDYAGGLMNKSFYLSNCGFFNHYTPLNTTFERPLLGIEPVIHFESLP